MMSQNLLLYFFVLCFQTNQYFEANLHLDFNEQNYSCGGDLILNPHFYVEIKFWLLIVYRESREYPFNQLAGSKMVKFESHRVDILEANKLII